MCAKDLVKFMCDSIRQERTKMGKITNSSRAFIVHVLGQHLGAKNRNKGFGEIPRGLALHGNCIKAVIIRKASCVSSTQSTCERLRFFHRFITDVNYFTYRQQP